MHAAFAPASGCAFSADTPVTRLRLSRVLPLRGDDAAAAAAAAGSAAADAAGAAGGGAGGCGGPVDAGGGPGGPRAVVGTEAAAV